MIKVTTTIEMVGSYPHTNVPRHIVFYSEMSSGGDNPRFFGDAVQRAIAKAAKEASEYMERLVDLRHEPIKVKPYMPERS